MSEEDIAHQKACQDAYILETEKFRAFGEKLLVRVGHNAADEQQIVDFGFKNTTFVTDGNRAKRGGANPEEAHGNQAGKRARSERSAKEMTVYLCDVKECAEFVYEYEKSCSKPGCAKRRYCFYNGHQPHVAVPGTTIMGHGPPAERREGGISVVETGGQKPRYRTAEELAVMDAALAAILTTAPEPVVVPPKGHRGRKAAAAVTAHVQSRRRWRSSPRKWKRQLWTPMRKLLYLQLWTTMCKLLHLQLWTSMCKLLHLQLWTSMCKLLHLQLWTPLRKLLHLQLLVMERLWCR
jgi:hypothetical protein